LAVGGTPNTGGSSSAGGAQATIRVQSWGLADSASATSLVIQVSVCDVSGATLSLSGITLKYWYTVDAASYTQMISIDYCPVTPAPSAPASFLAIDALRTNADAVAQLTFGSTLLATGACTGAIQMRIFTQSYSCCYAAQAGDYSYLASTLLTDNPKITAYNAQGLLIWGTEPPLAP
jgi:hypothetical protein